MGYMGDIRQGSAWRQLCKDMRAEQRQPCPRCGVNIDYSAKPRSRWSFSVDHILSPRTHPHLALEPSNTRAMHYGCNTAGGAHMKKVINQGVMLTPSPTRRPPHVNDRCTMCNGGTTCGGHSRAW